MNYLPVAIIQNSVINSDNFKALIHSLWGTNYSVFCSVDKFKYDPSKQFDIADIEYIYQEPSKLYLTLKEISFNKAYNDINEIFCYGDYCTKNTKLDLVKQRINEFWEIMHEQLDGPIITTLECKDTNSNVTYFDLNYVLISHTSGIYITLSSYD